VSGYRDIDGAVRVPLGFVPRVDIRVTDQYAAYTWRVGDGAVWSFVPAVNAVIDWDHTGQLQDRWTNADLGVSHAGQLDAHVSRAQASELYLATTFRTDMTNVSVSSSRVQWLSLWGMYSWGSAINYTPAAGVAPFLGLKRAAYGSITLRPSARLDLEQVLIHEQLDTTQDASSSNTPVFNTSLFRSKANLQLTRSLALRGIVDYSELDSDPSLFSESDANRLMYDVLVSYVLHPGTAVHVGFNKRYESLINDPRSQTGITPTGLTSSPVGHQIFVKINYLLRF
jgi:hypothetical protein